jgi:hypothetical protein
MVRSLINNKVSYPEKKNLFDEDKNFDASLYELELFGKNIIIALGQSKNDILEYKILYYPIYLVKNGKVNSQIGLYEILAQEAPNIFDEDGDIDINLLGEPLLYEFSSKLIAPNIEAKEITQFTKTSDLVEQTKTMSEHERKMFVDNKALPWIQKFMKNHNYKIINNEGSGDCLFASIRDGLKYAGINTSVDTMRKILAKNANQEVFDNYKMLFDNAEQEEKRISQEMKNLADVHKSLKEKLKGAKEKATQVLIIKNAEEIAKKHNEVKKERSVIKEMYNEFKFMKGIRDLDMFKLKVQTSEFWGDSWAISVLENALKIKLILFNNESFKQKDLDNVIQCGQIDNKELEIAGKFEPEYYIMLDYSGSHYQLITYKDIGAFNFNQIPYDIKMLILNKCLEKQAGPFYIIPDFRSLMEEKRIDVGSLEATVLPSSEMQSDLYDNSTIFQFYSKSLDKPLPGKGAGESIGPEGVKFYNELAKIPSWRRKLSNLWEQEFTLDGKRWLSVEHYYQAAKFKNSAPQYYEQFSLDSDSELSKDPLMANGAGSKNGKYKGEVIRPANIKIDENFNKVMTNGLTLSTIAMRNALKAKFNQHPELKTLLMETHKAKLQLFVRGSAPETADDLMLVRRELEMNL